MGCGTSTITTVGPRGGGAPSTNENSNSSSFIEPNPAPPSNPTPGAASSAKYTCASSILPHAEEASEEEVMDSSMVACDGSAPVESRLKRRFPNANSGPPGPHDPDFGESVSSSNAQPSSPRFTQTASSSKSSGSLNIPFVPDGVGLPLANVEIFVVTPDGITTPPIMNLRKVRPSLTAQQLQALQREYQK